jgi:hypothetical protein
MLFSTESTAFTKKEKRIKKERKAATTTNSSTSCIHIALYTYKGLGGEGDRRTLVVCAFFPHLERFFSFSSGLDAALSPHP